MSQIFLQVFIYLAVLIAYVKSCKVNLTDFPVSDWNLDYDFSFDNNEITFNTLPRLLFIQNSHNKIADHELLHNLLNGKKIF